MSLRLIGKIELPRRHLEDPQNEGIVAGKVWIDLKILDEDGELDSDEVIEQGFAGKARFGLRNSDGEEVVLFAGNGAETNKDGTVKRFTSGANKGKAKLAAGYELTGAGQAALYHSNGLRMAVNMKHQDPGCYTAFGEVEGVGSVSKWKVGDTFCVGKKAARKRPHR